MNAKPDMTGIDRYWKPGEDARIDIQRECGLGQGPIDSVLEALMKVVTGTRRTKIVGFGVFEWKPWNNRLPTGRRVKTWRLSFRPCRYKEKYDGDR